MNEESKWIDEGDGKLWISRKEHRIPSPNSLKPGDIVRISPRLEEFIEELTYDDSNNSDTVSRVQKFLKKWRIEIEMDLWIDPEMKKYSGKLAVVLHKYQYSSRVYLSIDNRGTSWDYRLLEKPNPENLDEIPGKDLTEKAQFLIKQQMPPKFKDGDIVVINPTRINTYTVLDLYSANMVRYVFEYGGDYYYDLVCDNSMEGFARNVRECDMELYHPHIIPMFKKGDIVVDSYEGKNKHIGQGIIEKVIHKLINRQERIEYEVKWLRNNCISRNIASNRLIKDPDQDIFEEFCNHRCKMCCPGNNNCPMFIYKMRDQ